MKTDSRRTGKGRKVAMQTYTKGRVQRRIFPINQR